MSHHFKYFIHSIQGVLKGKTTQNILWLFTEKATRFGFGLIVSVWVARYMGPEQFGQWNYIIAIVTLLGIIPYWGLGNIVIKELTTNPDNQTKTLESAFFIKFSLGLIVSGIIWTYSYYSNDDNTIVRMIAITSLIYIFQAFDVIDFYFQSKVESKHSVVARTVAYFVSGALKIALIYLQLDFFWFAITFLIEYIIIAIILVYVYHKSRIPKFYYRLNKTIVWSQIVSGFPLILASFAHWIYVKLDQLMIKEMLDYESLGYYSASIRITEALYAIPVVIIGSIFPKMVSLYTKEHYSYRLFIIKTLRYLLIALVLISSILSLSSSNFIPLLFGSVYNPTIDLFKIHLWVLIPVCLGNLSARMYIIEGLNIYQLYSTFSAMLVNIVFNFLLIPQFGTKGAAIATFITYVFVGFLFNGFFPKTRKIFSVQLESLNFLAMFRQKTIHQ